MEFGSLWEVLAVLVFLLAPVWRSVVETRRKAAEQQRKRSAAPPRMEEALDEEPPDIDPWEALLRGMDPERESAQAPVVPVEPEAFAPAEPPVAARQEDEHESLVDFPTYQETAYGAETYVNPGDEEVGGLAEELENREPAPRREFHSALEDRHVIGSGLSDLAPSHEEPEPRESARRRAIGALSMPASIPDWRTALVLAEVLAPPVALRPGGYRSPLDLPTPRT